MDPNEALNELLRLCGKIQEDDSPWFSKEDAAERVADLVVSLDAWITGGGFLPARWER